MRFCSAKNLIRSSRALGSDIRAELPVVIADVIGSHFAEINETLATLKTNSDTTNRRLKISNSLSIAALVLSAITLVVVILR